MGVVYQCPAVQATMQVFSCTGPAASDSCDVQTAPQGRPALRGKSTRQQVTAQAQAGPGGFKVGDTVRILADGWQEARVLQVRGNSYFVQLGNGIQVSKIWPMEVRRDGKLTAEDHAVGQYDNRDRVQVLINGRWMEGTIQGQNLNMYSIQVPGFRGDFDTDMVSTTPENIRVSTTPAPPPPAKRAARQAPKPGLVSCAGKYEGRWESTSGFGGNRVVFRSGKATVTEGANELAAFDCWMGGGEVLLYEPGSFKPFETLEVNNDGTLQTELGAIKKMGN